MSGRLIGAVIAVAVSSAAPVAEARPVVSFGLELGANLNPGLGGAYAPGVGRGYVLGVGGRQFTAEFLLGHSYSSAPSLSALHAANTEAEASLLAVGVRYKRQRKKTMLSLTGAVARVGLPLLNGAGEAFTVSGLGLLFGGGAAWRLKPSIALTADLRTVIATYEIPGEPYLVDLAERPDGTVGYTATVDDVFAVPIYATIGVRVYF